MKKFLSLVLLGLSLSTSVAFADVLPEGQTKVTGCAVLQNASAFTNTRFIVSRSTFGEAVSQSVDLLSDSTCVHGDKFEVVTLYAVDAAEYEKNSKFSDYDPASDVNAYPLMGGEGSTPFDVFDGYVDMPTQDTYTQRAYAVTGIDNEKRAITIAYLGEKTDTTDTRKVPDSVPEDMNSIKITTPIFDDVPATNKYALALAMLKRNGSVQGYDDGTFKTENLINRAEFTKIMMGNYNSTKTYDCAAEIFSDVPTSANTWYRDPVCMAYHEGVVAGYGDHTFKPEQNINYAEAAKIIVNAFRAAPNGTTDPWYKQFTGVFDSINGMPSTIKSPDQQITRGEMALMMYNITTHALELQ